jgi:hypothetical protein
MKNLIGENMSKYLITIFFLVISALFACVVESQENNTSTQVNTNKVSIQKCVTFDFRYLVLENELRSPTVRHIEIFLDDRAFSETNLKTLFEYLSKTNPDPKLLTIQVYSNWEQVPIPSDCPGTGRSNMPDKPDKYDYYQAIYYRNDRNGIMIETFEYNPVLKNTEFKKVILK